MPFPLLAIPALAAAGSAAGGTAAGIGAGALGAAPAVGLGTGIMPTVAGGAGTSMGMSQLLAMLLRAKSAPYAAFSPNAGDSGLAKLLKVLGTTALNTPVTIRKPGRYNLRFGDPNFAQNVALAGLMKELSAPPRMEISVRQPVTPTTKDAYPAPDPLWDRKSLQY